MSNRYTLSDSGLELTTHSLSKLLDGLDVGEGISIEMPFAELSARTTRLRSRLERNGKLVVPATLNGTSSLVRLR